MNYTFEDYIDEILDVPMIYIVRNGKNVFLEGKINFRQFSESGYEGYNATMEDFKLHENLCFPDVRLRNFIEIRNHDCSNQGIQYSILALYKSILYNNNAKQYIKKMLSQFNYKEIQEFRYNVPRTALATKIGKYYAADIAKEIISISNKSLKELKNGEDKYLSIIQAFVQKGVSPADIILKNWNGSWNKNILKLIKYLNN